MTRRSRTSWPPTEGEQLELGQAPPTPPPREVGLAEGRRRRNAGRRDAAAAAFTPWRRAFEDALARCASSGRPFTSDDVLAICGEPIASSANSVGALMGAAARRGQIERVSFEQSRRPSRQGAYVAVWRGAGGGAQ